MINTLNRNYFCSGFYLGKLIRHMPDTGLDLITEICQNGGTNNKFRKNQS
jgi:hypothetical protein